MNHSGKQIRPHLLVWQSGDQYLISNRRVDEENNSTIDSDAIAF